MSSTSTSRVKVQDKPKKFKKYGQQVSKKKTKRVKRCRKKRGSVEMPDMAKAPEIVNVKLDSHLMEVKEQKKEKSRDKKTYLNKFISQHSSALTNFTSKLGSVVSTRKSSNPTNYMLKSSNKKSRDISLKMKQLNISCDRLLQHSVAKQYEKSLV